MRTMTEKSSAHGVLQTDEAQACGSKPAGVSAIRAAIEASAPTGMLSVRSEDRPRGKPDEPITQELVKRLGDMLLWRILVELHVPKYRGKVDVSEADNSRAAEQNICKVGRVVAEGCMVWKSRTNAGLSLQDETNRPGLDDYVLFEMYAGQEITLRSGHILRVLSDSECLMRVKDPDLIRGYL